MTDQYVFELQFKGKTDGSDYRENQFVIIDGSTMAEFAKLKEDLGMCLPEPFTVQYIDDEEDVISIDTEEEFQEFAKIAKQRSSRGMLMRLILNSTLPMDHGHLLHQERPKYRVKVKKDKKRMLDQQQRPEPSSSCANLNCVDYGHRRDLQAFKDKIKSELMDEILLEFQARAANVAAPTEEETRDVDYEEDSDCNLSSERIMRKAKLMLYRKKLEKKEKHVESKIDERLEKLEMKKKKLMEKHYSNTLQKAWNQINYQPLDSKPGPMIYSVIATKESCESRRVAPLKVFTHVWTIVNDGTVVLNLVELRHTWSSPGLEPEETSHRLPPLAPGQQCSLPVRMRAPAVPSTNFISYWHFYRLDSKVHTNGVSFNQWKEFGHFVSLTGSTKSRKNSAQDIGDSKVHESNKKAKHEGKKTVRVAEPMEVTLKEPQKEEKVLNEESNITLKKQMEQLQAKLASTEIAAEMAREAARLLAMASGAEGNRVPGVAPPKPSEGDKLNNCELEEAVQQLNLVDSGESDTDTNMEMHDEFVIVEHLSSKEDGKTVTQTDKSKEEPKLQPAPVSQAKADQPDKSRQGPLQFPPLPRMDPNTYPVFPPPPPRVGGYPAPSPLLMHQAMHTYNYTNPASHGIVFPPPVTCSQIPTYQTYHHPSAVPMPLSTVPHPMVPQQGQNLPAYPFVFMNSRQKGEKMVPNEPERTAENPVATPVDKPTETTTAENCGANATSEKPMETNAPQVETIVEQNTEANPPEVASPPAQAPQQQEQRGAETNPPTREQKDPVALLPQALVDGAINVAATAYSTAWNALNTLRPKEGEASEFDPVFENNMVVLVEMGFNNLERNARLLKRFNNDIGQVIAVICSTGGGHNLDID